MSQVVNIFCLLEFSEELRDSVLCISWGNQDPISGLTFCCLIAPPLSLHLFSSMFEPALWNSRKVQKWGTQKDFHGQEPHRVLLGFSPTDSSLSLTRLPPLQLQLKVLSCHLCFWWTGYKSERFLWTPPWVQSMCQSSSQNSENTYLHLPVYYKR